MIADRREGDRRMRRHAVRGGSPPWRLAGLWIMRRYITAAARVSIATLGRAADSCLAGYAVLPAKSVPMHRLVLKRFLTAMPALARSAPPASQSAEPCRSETFEDAGYIVCSFDLAKDDLRMFWRNGGGRALQRPSPRSPRRLQAQGLTLTFAMNGGMYGDDFSPIGLYVEEGRELAPANTKTVTGEPRPDPEFLQEAERRLLPRRQGGGRDDDRRVSRVAAEGATSRRSPGRCWSSTEKSIRPSSRTRPTGSRATASASIEPDRGAFRHHRGPREFLRFRALLPRQARLRRTRSSSTAARRPGSMRRSSSRDDAPGHGGYGPIIGVVKAP